MFMKMGRVWAQIPDETRRDRIIRRSLYGGTWLAFAAVILAALCVDQPDHQILALTLSLSALAYVVAVFVITARNDYWVPWC